MQVKIPLVTGLFGLLLVKAIPSYAQTVDAPTTTVDAWKKMIVSRLVSKREYPPAALRQGGTAKVQFTIDRQGKLLSRELVESSGSELLDAAALRIVERAEPFPEPPAELTGLTFRVPMTFTKPLPGPDGQMPLDWDGEERKVKAKIQTICRGC
jgi:periplasmic protein TonB